MRINAGVGAGDRQSITVFFLNVFLTLSCRVFSHLKAYKNILLCIF